MNKIVGLTHIQGIMTLKIASIILMRVFLLFIGIGLGAVYANPSYAQTKITIDANGITYEELFNRIQGKSEFIFFYKDNVLNPNKKVYLQIKKAELSTILDRVFLNTDLDYSIDDRQVVIKKRDMVIQAETGIHFTPQDFTVSGTVTDTQGIPLAGASVLEKGTTNGTQSDFDGNYTLSLSNASATLTFSYIGYGTKDIPVNNQNSISIVLEESASDLDEVVVIGYGVTVKKKDLTGAVASADLDNANEFPNVSIAQALQGSVAGLNVGATTNAGQNPIISVRGQSTLSSDAGANAPLIVLDGIIYRGNLVDLNPADIASIDVLKDASSAAIYGSQASNGVILITTKTGRTLLKPTIEYSTSYSIQSPSNVLLPMNASELEEFYPDIFWAEGGRLAPDYLQVNPDYVWQNNFKTTEISEGYANGQDTPWWDLFSGSGFVNTHNLSIRGKTEAIGYFVSGGITDQQAYLKNDKYTRYNFRINFDANITDWLKIGTQTFVSIGDFSGVTGGNTIPFVLQPWAPIRDEDREIIPNPEGGWLNPFLTIAQDDSEVEKNFFSNLYADVKLPLNGLSYRLNYSNNYRTQNNARFNPSANSFTGGASKSYAEARDWTLDNILTYQRTFNEDHNINLTLLYGVEKRNINSFRAEAKQFGIDILGFNRLQAGDPTQNVIESNKEEETSLYSMVRLLYDYKNKYYITGTVRRDGFSGFGKKDKTAVFPTVGLGWVISNEGLFENSSWVDFLKLRASYGQSGRRGLGRYDTAAIISTGPSYVFGDGGQSYQGQSISSLPNDALGWETTTGTNLGLDFALIGSKLRGNIEYYKNDTENILYAIQLPNLTGFNSINSNIAKVSNHGLELVLSSTLVGNDDWNWEASFNFSSYRNKIESILGPQNDNNGDGKEDDLVGDGLFIGEPQNVIYDYEITGMWQLADEADGSILTGFFPGTYKLRDLDNSGDISSLDDRKILGYEDPAYRFGIANTVSHKNLSLYVFINSIQGGNDFYYGNDAPHAHGNWNKRDQLSYSNVPKGAWDYWMPENPNAKYRRLDLASQFGATPYSQRSFVRLQDVSLSYVFPDQLQDALRVSNLKLFVSGKNLATWTKWKGLDPETGAGFAPGAPLLRSYTLGLNVEF
ncbi:TonB-dependent receptor [Pareuzebyella sediminis]|uniref:TonB-dependent receptor n=1 Tax=Pareuzebyella sediminis TaxID=2607998 RepID=UPI0011ECBDBB|nr:TonB-dependent receptor [Pareuzebyella sediminis]